MRLKRKIGPFFFGVTIGLLAGVGFFIFKINDWFAEMRSRADEKITVIQQPVKIVEEKAEVEKKRPPREKLKIDLGKSTPVNYREVDSLIKEDSRITIATDELLSVKNVKVIRIDDNPADVTDSAAAVADVSETDAETVQVEFWKTPLNSKGYRFSKRKVMLYGFPDFSNVLVYQMDNDYYLRSSDQWFRLQYTAEFKPPDKVTDPGVISRLN